MQNFYQKLETSLKDLYPKGEIRIFKNLILERITGLPLSKLLTEKNLLLSDVQNKQADEFISRLKNHEPMQYILGETEFYGLTLKVNPSVLIPRPETEELVEWVLSDLQNLDQKGTKAQILDIGTGSGCIPIALKARLNDLHVSAMDISAEALEVAKENADLNHVDIDFFQDDILNPAPSNRKWDVIVSNPPYIPYSEKDEVDKQVTDYEPQVALYSPSEKPLIFYDKIASFAVSHLNPQGKIYFEVHKNMARGVAMLLGDHGFQNVIIKVDISGNERMVRGDWVQK